MGIFRTPMDGRPLATRFRALPVRWRKRSRWALTYLSNRTLQMDELPPWSNSLEDTSRRYMRLGSRLGWNYDRAAQSVERRVSLENRDTHDRATDWVIGMPQRKGGRPVI